MFSAETGWTIVEQRKRQPGPLAGVGRSLTRSTSVGSALRQQPDTSSKPLGCCDGKPARSRSTAGLPQCAKAVSSTMKLSAVEGSFVHDALNAGGYPKVAYDGLSDELRRLGMDSDSDESRDLCEGMVVELHSLQGAIELNGRHGTLTRFDIESGRWFVDVDDVGEKKVKPSNMRRLASTLQKVEENWSDKWKIELKHRSDISKTRQQRRVEATLQALSSCFHHAEGLEAAADSLAKEALARIRTSKEQQEHITAIAKPKEVLQPPELTPPPTPPSRSQGEQQAYFDLLACPRLPPKPPTPLPQRIRSVAAQQQRCTELNKQPRWKEELAARADALALGEVASAQALLIEMRARASDDSKLPRWSIARPSSAQSRADMNSETIVQLAQRRRANQLREQQRRGQEVSPECEALAADLRELVEEILWAVLLQVRCCRKVHGIPAERATKECLGGVADIGLDDRLCNLLISAVGSTLRPIARKVIASGTNLSRRLRVEFPKLAGHLGLRESEEVELPTLPWSSEELATRIKDVRVCRDQLLSMDLTKMLMNWIGK